MKTFENQIFMTDFEKQFLARLKVEGSFTIEGNREYWEIIYFGTDSNWLSIGDTMENRERVRKKISDEKALELIKSHYLHDAGIYDYDGNLSAITLEEVLKLTEKN